MNAASLRAVAAAFALAVLAGCATTQQPPLPEDAAPPQAAGAPADVVVAVPEAVTDVVVAAPEPAASAPEPEADVPAAAPPVDPLRPEVIVDPADAAARADLWLRVRRGFALDDLDGDLVRRHERAYASKPDYVARMTERAGRYLFHIVEEVERRGMPTELALLPFIESAFNPQAMSVARASGMWQFIPSTGRIYELTQNVFRDDRRDVLASTRAALDYLTRLHGMFGDWHLALAAYNWGEGSVQRAMASNRRAGKPTGYEHLRMPRETRNYVPKLQAMKNIVARPDAFALELPPLENHPYFLAVPVERDIDVALAARLAGIELDDFKALNPQMNQPLILAAGTPYVLLPYDNANRFVHEVNAHKGPLASWTAWVAPKTMRPAEVAKLVGMDEDELRSVNRIPPRMLVRTGSTLLVPRSARRDQDIAEHIADHAMIAFAPDGPPVRKLSVKAGKGGESVAQVARRYKVSAAQVASWNGVSAASTFRAGQSIVVYVAQKASGGNSRKTAAPRATKPAKARSDRR